MSNAVLKSICFMCGCTMSHEDDYILVEREVKYGKASYLFDAVLCADCEAAEHAKNKKRPYKQHNLRIAVQDSK